MYGRRLIKDGAFLGKALAAALALAAFMVMASPAWAGTFTVTNTNDSGAGSLRQAITDANNTAGDDTIEFASGVTGTIELASALPDLSTNIEIKGPGAGELEVRRSTAAGTPQFRIFTVTSSGTVSISGLTISNGSVAFNGPAGLGGGVYSNGGGNLTLEKVSVNGNTATDAYPPTGLARIGAGRRAVCSRVCPATPAPSL